MKINHVLIPAIAMGTILGGRKLTTGGLGWYKTVRRPSWTPPGAAIGAVWSVIYTLTTISALIAWNSPRSKGRLAGTGALFAANAALNASWSYLFFRRHEIGLAVAESAVLDASVVSLMVRLWPVSRTASMLLMPYAAWVAFATYLNSEIWAMNRQLA
jgi:translocator protein